MPVTINGDTGVSKTQPTSVPWMSGMILAFGNETAPDGWLSCDGSAVSRTTYSDLFSAIGTKWGSGDGSTTFNVPDLRATYLEGAGANPDSYRNGVDDTDGYYGDDKNAGAGLGVGEEQRDQMQGHWHDFVFHKDSAERGSNFNSTDIANPALDTTQDERVQNPISDGTNGTPRTGKDIQVHARGVLYCIKT